MPIRPMSLIMPAVVVLLVCAGTFLVGVGLWITWVAYVIAGVFDARRLSDLDIPSALKVAVVLGVGVLLISLAVLAFQVWQRQIRQER